MTEADHLEQSGNSEHVHEPGEDFLADRRKLVDR